MNAFGKSLTVAAAFGSIAFMAFAMSLALGGPNWLSELDSPSIAEDLVVKVDPKTPSTPANYTLSVRRPEGNQPTAVGATTPLLPKVVIEGKQWKLKSLGEKTKASNDLATQQETNVASRKGEVEKDRLSFETRQKTLRDYIDGLDKQLATLLEEQRQVSLENEVVIKQVRERVAEGYRLQNQLELIRDDSYTATEQRKALQDELTQLTTLADRLERRNEQLKTATASSK